MMDGERLFEAKSVVSWFAYGMGRDPSLWKDPLKYEPMR